MSKATVTIEGFIANDLKVDTTNSGKRVVTISVPHTPQKKEGTGWVDAGPTTWFEASFWEEHVDYVLDTVQKGTLVVLSGIPEVQAYPKRDGDPGAKVLVQFPQLSVVVRRPKRGASSPQSGPTESWATSAPGADVTDYTSETPF